MLTFTTSTIVTFKKLLKAVILITLLRHTQNTTYICLTIYANINEILINNDNNEILMNINQNWAQTASLRNSKIKQHKSRKKKILSINHIEIILMLL